MKRFYLLLVCALCTIAASAAYSVGDVPNVHLQDSTKFVSDPTGIMTEQGRAQADASLRSLMAQTSVEPVVVMLDDIDGDPDDFATDLFRSWGIGKKDNNNGLLILVVKDQHKVVIRTGGGLEGLMPDGLCGSIIRHDIAPRFRQDDYDGGINAAIQTVTEIISTPEGREEVLSRYGNNRGAGSESGSLFRGYLMICCIWAAVLLIIVAWKMVESRKKPRYERYQELSKLYTPALISSFVGLGLPLIAFIPLALMRHRLRRGPHYCPECHTRMQLVDEVHDNDYLNSAQDMEEKLGAVDYDVWVCPRDGQTEIIPYVERNTAYTECPVCHARTMRVVSSRIMRQPTTTQTGQQVTTFRCMHCGYEDQKYKTLPKVTPPIVIVGPGGGGGGGGGFGGGSFGGGTTFGGGASGGW